MKISLFMRFTTCLLVISLFQVSAKSYSDQGLQEEEINITGNVRDAMDEAPLPGVNIILKGTNRGTITDVDGNFSLTAPADGTLLFTYVGYAQQEVEINGKREIKISLKHSLRDIDEVVVMGYSSKTRAELSSAVDVVKASELMDITAVDVGSMLQGKVAGVQVINSSGEPGRAAQIRIRGISTIKPGNEEPLYVVDGIIGGSFDPNDVETITVLKDAGATGMYGARANKGVIIVTTKSAKTGKPQFEIKATIGYRLADYGNLTMMNSSEFYDASREMYRDSETHEIDEIKFLEVYPEELLERDFDWVGETFQPAISQNYYLSTSASKENFSYYLSSSYYNEEGTFRNTGFERLNLRLNTTYKLSNKVSLTNNINISGSQGTYFNYERMYQTFLSIPWDNAFNEDGTARFVDGKDEDWWFRDSTNPIHSIDHSERTNKGGDVNYDLVFNYNISKWLTFSSANRIGFSTSKYHDFISPLVSGTYYSRGSIHESQWLNYGGISTNLLKFKFNINKHSISGLAGVEFDVRMSEFLSAEGKGLPEGFSVPAVASSEIAIGGASSKEVFQSFISQLNYNYNNKYFLSGSYRIDATSNFPPDNRSAHFPTVSASWLISNESFLDNLAALNLLKFRLSYGITGDPDIGASRYMGLFALNTQYNNNVAAIPYQLQNYDLTWEKTEELNFGMNIGLFNRIDLSLDIYNNLTRDLIVLAAQPLSQGFEYRWENGGEVRNSGIELTLSTINIKTSSFEWTTDLTIAHNKNELTEITTPFYRTVNGISQIYREGIPIYTYVIPKWLGVDEETGSPLWEQVIRDENGDIISREPTSKYQRATPQEVGNALPTFQGGFRSTMTYKNISFLMTLVYQYGNDIYNSTRVLMDHDGHEPYYNYMKPKDDWSRWQEPGDIATHPSMQNARLSKNTSSRYLEDGGYMKIRNVTLRYDFPKRMLTRVKLHGLAISLKADNIFTHTNYWGQDPEVTLNQGDWSMPGVSDFKYPNNKQFLFNVEIKF